MSAQSGTKVFGRGRKAAQYSLQSLTPAELRAEVILAFLNRKDSDKTALRHVRIHKGEMFGMPKLAIS